MTIADSITRDGMGQDKTVRVNGKTGCLNSHLSFSTFGRFPLQFAPDLGAYSSAVLIR
jgi:hypothetical protein